MTFIMENTFDVSGKTALVTGANRGLGRAIAARLVAAGARRVYAAMRTPHELPGVPAAIPTALDVTDDESVAAAARRHPDVELLVNNAGVLSGAPLLSGTLEGAAHEMDVNYFGPLRMVRAFAPVLAANGGGAIVNVLSILSRVNLPRVGSYSASKAAALSLTQAVRAELAAQRTVVVAAMPAFIDTDMIRGVALPKLSPEAVAEAIVAALRDGVEDVYPGPAADIAAQLAREPKAVERHFAQLLAPSR